MELARFKKTEQAGNEQLTYYWLIGPDGAVSTWFSDTKEILGHSVCSGVTWHSPRPHGNWEHYGACEFLETDCWISHGSMLWLEPVEAMFDQGDEERIWAWLTAHAGLLGEDPEPESQKSPPAG